jgi:hypothetical protein
LTDTLIRTSEDQQQYLKWNLAKVLGGNAPEDLYYMTLILQFLVNCENISEKIGEEKKKAIMDNAMNFQGGYNYCMIFKNIIKSLTREGYNNKAVIDDMEKRIIEVSKYLPIINLKLAEDFVYVTQMTDLKRLGIPNIEIRDARNNQDKMLKREDYKRS